MLEICWAEDIFINGQSTQVQIFDLTAKLRKAYICNPYELERLLYSYTFTVIQIVVVRTSIYI